MILMPGIRKPKPLQKLELKSQDHVQREKQQ